MIYDLIIIGGGIAGLSAAIQTNRFNLKALVLTKKIGGVIRNTHIVENYPGIKNISGESLSNLFIEHAKSVNVKIVEEFATDLYLQGKLFYVKSNKSNYKGHSVIYATGGRTRRLGLFDENRFVNKGLYYSHLYDNNLLNDKVFGVVGGSDSAVREAIFLSEYARKVYIIYRKDKLRAEPISLEKIHKNKKIVIVNNAEVVALNGGDFIESVDLNRKYKSSNKLQLDGLFINIGFEPQIDLASKVGVKLNGNNEIVINRQCETNIKGLFAAGDCTDEKWKQAITAASGGSIAVHSAYCFLKSSNS